MCTRPSASRQQAAGATNDGQAERMALWVTQRALAPIYVRRVAQAHGASGEGRTGCHTPKNELDAGTRCIANALDKAVRTRASERKRRAGYRDVRIVP
jgi:hypothetical protein